MKTTVDIPREMLEEAIRYARAQTKREAILTAISEFIRRRRLAEVAERFGTFEGFPTREELLRLRERR